VRRTSDFYGYLRGERDRAAGETAVGSSSGRRASLLATLADVGSKLSGERK
jgi:hypothetical protein